MNIRTDEREAQLFLEELERRLGGNGGGGTMKPIFDHVYP